ncbi:MAG: OprO/OprP family phosphate-selective porin, partial [Alistipes sp.]|uniref:porin n=1 Tax=Alistipes sp. TaxID=1872444 RepID=UPI0025C08728
TYQTNVGGVDGKSSSSFNVKRMRLILTGDISRTFDYKMQFEGFSSSADQQGKALITVQDMYLRAKIRPQIHIWAGQFPVPLTIENYDISPGTLEVPNFSHAILKMVCRNAVSGYNTYGRDCGLQATGAFLRRDGWDMLTYNLALFNGSQMNRSDDNKSKDIVARLTFFPLRELRISGSVNWGEYTNNTISKDYIPMTRYAAGFWYDSEHILVRAEYAHTGSSTAYTDKTTGEKARGRVDEQMYYLIAGYKFKGKYMPVIRYDVFNGKRNTYLPGSVGKQQDFLAGFLYMPVPRLKAQAAWTLSKYSAAGAKNSNTFEVTLIGFF